MRIWLESQRHCGNEEVQVTEPTVTCRKTFFGAIDALSTIYIMMRSRGQCGSGGEDFMAVAHQRDAETIAVLQSRGKLERYKATRMRCVSMVRIR